MSLPLLLYLGGVEMDYRAVGKRIRNERIGNKLTQAELAEKVNVTTAYIGQIERGERKFSIETLLNIATVLNVSVDYLLREEDNLYTASLHQQMTSLLDDRGPEDIAMAIDIIKAVFERLKSK